jgi:hypothetical protein
MIRKLIESKRIYALVLFTYLAISLIMFWNVTAGITHVVPGSEDAFQSLWNLWWVPYSVFTLHQSPYHTSLLYYPIGSNLISQTMTPLSGILTAPLQLISLAFTYNFLFFASFALGGLFMFMLAFYLTKNNYASFIAGLIFAFSPMHIAHAYSQLQWGIIEFIPLYILCFILMVRTKERKYALLSGLSFVLLTFMGDIEQGIIIVLFTILSLIVLLFIDRKEILNKKTYINVGILIASILVIGSPFFAAMLPYLNSGAIGQANQLSDVAHNMLYSDTILSYLLPSYYNGIFHGISKTYYNQSYGLTYNGAQYNPNPTEKTAYLGYSILFLVIIGLYYGYKKDKLKTNYYWIIIGVLFFLLSLGPYIQLANSPTPIPSLYMLYRDIPLFNLAREPGRFDVIVTVCLAIFAAMGFDHLEKNNRSKNAFILAILFSGLILIEYNGMPLSHAFANSLVGGTSIPKAYYEIGKIQGNFSTLVLPALPDPYTTSFLYPSMATYYQTATHKPLIGGYTTRVNSSQELSLENVPLVVSASYLQSGSGLVFPYPILENYTNLTMLWLSLYNTRFVSVIRNAYSVQQQEQLLSYLVNTFGNESYQDQNTTVFTVSSTEEQHALNSTLAYTVGSWIPGFDMCSSPYVCNQTLSNMWWGNNVRGMMIYTPKSSAFRLNLTAMNYLYSSPLYVYLGNSEAGVFNVTAQPENYSIVLNLTAGFNPVAFYQQNNSSINFGLQNITISKIRNSTR